MAMEGSAGGVSAGKAGCSPMAKGPKVLALDTTTCRPHCSAFSACSATTVTGYNHPTLCSTTTSGEHKEDADLCSGGVSTPCHCCSAVNFVRFQELSALMRVLPGCLCLFSGSSRSVPLVLAVVEGKGCKDQRTEGLEKSRLVGGP